MKKILLLFVILFTSILIKAQDVYPYMWQDVPKYFTFLNIDSLISSTDITYEVYEKQINRYLLIGDKKSAEKLIISGIGKITPVFYSHFMNAVFYPQNDKEFLSLLNKADSIIDNSCDSCNIHYCRMLRHMYIEDQKYRQKISYINYYDTITTDSIKKCETKILFKLAAKADSINVEKLDSLIKVDKRKTFLKNNCDVIAKRIILMIIIHADRKPEFQYKMATKYKKDIINIYGNLGYAVIYDRYLFNKNEHPRYYEYNPLEIPVDKYKKTNNYREKIGLKKLENK